MARQGMDDAVVDGVVQQMRRMAGQLQTIAASVDGEVTRVSGVWLGEASTQMVADWRGHHAPGLRAAADSVATFAGRLSENVSAQRVTSDTYVGDSSLRGHLGSGPGGGRGGGGGGDWVSEMIHIPQWVVTTLGDKVSDPGQYGEEFLKFLAHPNPHFSIRDGHFGSVANKWLDSMYKRPGYEAFVSSYADDARAFKFLSGGLKWVKGAGYVASTVSIGADVYLSYESHANLPFGERALTAAEAALPDAGGVAGALVGQALIPIPVVGAVVGGVVGQGVGEVAEGLIEHGPEIASAAKDVADDLVGGIGDTANGVSKFLGGLKW